MSFSTETLDAPAHNAVFALSDATGLDDSIKPVQLSLVFSRERQNRTFLKTQYCSYPFHICRAFYLDRDQPDIATVYLQSSAGGLFAADRLQNRFEIHSNARAHVTTQSATVAHRMRNGQSRQGVEIITQADAYFEYMPDPLILFPEADVDSRVEVTLATNACVLICDAFMTHDPGLIAEPFRKLVNTIHAKSYLLESLYVGRHQSRPPIPCSLRSTLYFAIDRHPLWLPSHW